MVTNNFNIVIPMGGKGTSFASFDVPKPLIQIGDKPMLQYALESLQAPNANYIFIVHENLYKFNIINIIEKIIDTPTIITARGEQQGAAYSTLLATSYIDNETPLLIANCDQYEEWDGIYDFNNDGFILVFNDDNPRSSYVTLDKDNFVNRVVEKQNPPISNIATTGHYGWTKGSSYIKYANQMIKKGLKVKWKGREEYYVAPVYQQAIENGKRITVKYVDKHIPLGSPEEVELFRRSSVT